MNFGSNNLSSCGSYRSLSGRPGQVPSSAMACSGVNPNSGFGSYSASMPNMSGGGQGVYGYQKQTSNSRMRQQTGRTNPRNPACFQSPMSPAMPSPQMQMQMQQMSPRNNNVVGCSPGGAAAPNLYGQPGAPPCPVNLKFSAAQLASAKNYPLDCDRQECSVQGHPDVKYITLGWDQLLGKTGMDGMKISMMPPGGDPAQNRQLKVSFGGQKGNMQAGETPLKVVSFEPVSSGRINKNSPPSIQQAPSNYNGGGQQQRRGGGEGRQCSCPNCR